ncbi:hypothetical protein [Actinokineospora xionganensis]|uniref:Uncharacterized protein n=1 Tax=Actinokineospora xionganensis TaxID=2684470 RepID=A0ABR7LBD3_9PSEU|nr:hypothetical protein [Actinokineospora xionganensis]MBC6450000.1 hypothetical protein [Actinokineospora xionganensis]
MGLQQNLREPAGLAAAVLLGALAAAVTAARTDSGWLALPVGVGVAGLVLLVKAALTKDSAAVPARARELLRRICLTAVDVRLRATTVHDADPVMAPTARVVDAAYRLAALVARNDLRLAPTRSSVALATLTDCAARMAVLAKRVDGTAPSRISGLVEELGLLKRNLENAESAVDHALKST